jgi:polar amino acid transport system substrate-binding protein
VNAARLPPRRRPCWPAGLALAWSAMACAPAGARELLVVGAHFERVYERGANGEFSGIGAELVRMVARQLNDTVRFEIYPWPRAQAMVSQGQADILVGPYKTPERLAAMAFSQRPFYRDQMVFYHHNENEVEWHGDYRALKERRIVILNGWAYGERFGAARDGLRVSVANSVESGLKMLSLHRVDLFATNRRNAEPVVAALGLADWVSPMLPAIEVQDGYFAFPRDAGHEALRARFDAAFNAMVDAGTLKKLGQRLDVNTP